MHGVRARTRRSRSRASSAAVERARASRERSSRPSSSSRSGTTSRAATLGVDARASATRSLSGVSCSWPTAETTGTGHAAIARTSRSSLNGRRSSKLPPPRARMTTSTPGAAATRASASTIAAAARGPCTYVSATSTSAGGKRVGERGEHVALRGRVVARDEADAAREAAAAAACAPRRRGPRRASFGFRRSSAARCAPRPNRSIESARRRKSPLRLEEVGPPVDVDALAVGEVEAQRVEAAAPHRDAEAGAVGRVLEREEDGLPALLAAELGDLALDPDGGQAREPLGDAAVERGDGVDLPVAVLDCLDLHRRQHATRSRRRHLAATDMSPPGPAACLPPPSRKSHV